MDIAFIGAGSIAAKHRENLNAIPDVTLSAICDIDEEAATDAAAPFDAEVYTDHAKMYEEEAIDAVFIVIPPFAHTTQEIAAAEQGIPIFVEKPVALQVEQAEKIHDHIAVANIINQAGYVLRFSNLIEWVTELISPSDVSFVEGNYSFPGAPESSWWREHAKSGGQVVEQGTHVFDIVRYLFGDVERIYAAGERRMVEAIDFPDTTAAILEHDTGVVSQITSTIAVPDKQLSVRAVGPEVDLTIDFIANRVIGTVRGESVDYEATSDPFVIEIETFIEAISTGEPALVERSSYREAIKTLELTLAVNDAVDTAKPVELA